MRTKLLTAVVFAIATFTSQDAARAAQVDGDWDMTVNETEFPLSISNFAIVLLVEAELEEGAVFGIGASAGRVVFWGDQSGAFFFGFADNPGRPSSLFGLAFGFVEGIGFWTATRVVPE